jgi:two-component system, OmpR family, alkaline phosphatase synthesis response regulator PhoP
MSDRKRRRLLLADNLAEYRRSVRGFLVLEAFTIDEAGTPEEAIEMLERREYNLVLVDLRMVDDNDRDDMSGLEVAQFAHACGIPCIIVTAFPTVELARTALRARGVIHAQDLIPKKDGPQALIDSISRTLREQEERESRIDPTPSQPKGLRLAKGRIYKDETEIKLPKNQFALVAELCKKDGDVCKYAELMLAVYGESENGHAEPQDRRLRNLVDRTSKRIDDKDHHYIEAVTGRGYLLKQRP